MQVLLANPRGFCAGVDRAIDIVERALELFGPPIYVRHEVVHNRHVVERLRALGAIFVDELAEVPSGCTVIFSAHGVSSAVEQEAHGRRLTVFNATCPLVTKVHMEVQRYAREGRDVILIGHAGHPEVEGTMGRFDASFGGRIHLVEDLEDVAALGVRDPASLALVTQTTLSVDDTAEIVALLKQRFPAIVGPHKEDICYATTNRQEAVKRVAADVDALIVVGSPNSSNSQRLKEVAERAGCPYAALVQSAAEVDWPRLDCARSVGITAGASAPEVLVEEIIDALGERYDVSIDTVAAANEDVFFPLPRPLRDPQPV
jgi:4-hydroxy-3-methylbut-2-enyl diphosphate reductase